MVHRLWLHPELKVTEEKPKATIARKQTVWHLLNISEKSAHSLTPDT